MGESQGKARRALRSLCCDNGWSYGVLWRFDPRNSMLLTMEEAFYQEEHIRQVIGSKLLLQVHVLGEGVIGQAAVTAKHQWILADAQENELADPDVLLQFSAGLETLVVIPLEQHGVVQFGAKRRIMEKPEFVDRTKMMFFEMDSVTQVTGSGNTPSSSLSETHNISSMFASSLLPQEGSCDGNARSSGSGFGLEELIRNTCSTTASQVKGSSIEGPCISSWSSEGSVLTSLDPWMLSGSFDPSNPYCMKLNTGVGNFGNGHFQSLGEAGNGLPKGSSELKRSMDEFNIAKPIAIADVSNLCLMDDLSQWLDGSTDHGMAEATGYLEGVIEQSILGSSGYYNRSNVLNMEGDPLDSLGFDMDCILDGNSWEALGNCNRTANDSLLGCPSMSAPRKGLFSELGIEELLEGVQSTTTKLKDPLLGSKRKPAEESLWDGEDGYAHKEFLPRSQVGLWIGDSYSINAGGASACPPKRVEEPGKSIRKRARPGESTRPRPKDRQLIQDRLKELRGIIPNGTKCSIDALLDRTVKHMLFLQNVMKYADKVKPSEEPKPFDDCRMSQERGNGGGKTWAFEMGCQSMVCPIIVEDLSSPGQMLIEMLCEERGLFLEIADIIRGFGLNILKGVMEVRESKVWSHFIVEATRNVTRMDVFWSLVQILQQPAPSRSDISDHLNHLTDGAVLPCKSYKQSHVPISIS